MKGINTTKGRLNSLMFPVTHIIHFTFKNPVLDDHIENNQHQGYKEPIHTNRKSIFMGSHIVQCQ